MKTPSKTQQRTRRHARVRAKVVGTKERPRLSVYKSNTRLSAQIIDDRGRHDARCDFIGVYQRQNAA
jgi:ribosomal protein L18